MILENQVRKMSILDVIKKILSNPHGQIVFFGFILILVQIFGNLGLIRPSLIENITRIYIYFLVGLGFTLLLGYAGLASLGTSGFIGIGTYVIGYLVGLAGMPLLLAALIGFILSLVLGTIIGFISLRVEGMYLAIITLGLSESLVEIFKNWSRVTGGYSGITISRVSLFGQLLSSQIVYQIIVVTIVLAMMAVINIIQSPTGRAMLAIKNSTSAAQSLGISVLKYRLMTFIIATVLAVLGGMLYMLFNLQSEPGTWNIDLSLKILAAVVIGGSKSIWGVGLGTFFVFGLHEFILKPLFPSQPNTPNPLPGNISLILNGVLIILVVMFYPGGLNKLFKDLASIFKKIYHFIIDKVKESQYGKDYPKL